MCHSNKQGSQSLSSGGHSKHQFAKKGFKKEKKLHRATAGSNYSKLWAEHMLAQNHINSVVGKINESRNIWYELVDANVWLMNSYLENNNMMMAKRIRTTLKFLGSKINIDYFKECKILYKVGQKNLPKEILLHLIHLILSGFINKLLDWEISSVSNFC